MATQILGTDHAALLPCQTDTRNDEIFEMHQEGGNAFRGLIFAMLFNFLLLLTGAAGWELWRLIR